MGSAQPALAEGSTPAGQTEPRSGYVISEQCPLRGVDAPSAGGSEDLERDLLSQANGTIWHPRPELWALYIWPLNGSLLASQSEC